VIRRQSLSSALVREIQHRASKGEFKPGEKLPPQNELAARFGVSRTALREALQQLALMGTVEIKHGTGTFVCSSPPSSLFDSLSPLLLMDKATTFELLEARLYVESTVALLAAKRRGRKDVEQLTALVEGMKADLSQGRIDAFSQKDLEFHLLVAKASKNHVLVKILQTLRDMLQQFISEALISMPGISKSALNYHLRILRAIEKHRGDEAQKHMRNHILHVMRSLKQYYGFRKDQSDRLKTDSSPSTHPDRNENRTP
jgi:GntR family transcriptional repressor for pyruvate dehydrogenase complex